MTIHDQIIAVITRHPGCSTGRITRQLPETEPQAIADAVNDLLKTYRVEISGKKLRIIKDAEKAAFNAMRKTMFDTDEHHKILRQTRSKMLRLINHGRPIRDKKFTAILGCTTREFVSYLESLFEPGMNWQNHGVGPGKWHIDHITPCAEHDLTCATDFEKCWHHTNMRPLWASENLRLGATVRRKHK